MKKPAINSPAVAAVAGALALAALGSSAHADPDADTLARPVSIAPHVTTGVEIAGNGDVTSVTWRSYLGVSAALGRGGLRPSLALGGTFGRGSFEVPDARALTGMLSVGYFELGPEVRLGLRWVDGGLVDTHLFASFAYLRTTIDQRVVLAGVDIVPERQGMRAALGVNWAQQIGRVASRSTGAKEDVSWLVVVLPDQLELVWERSYGSDRYGVTISYGI